MNELRGTVRWADRRATATIGDKVFVFSEQDPDVPNQCTVVDQEGKEVASSSRESSFMRGTAETFLIGGQPSGLTLKRGMLNTRVTWEGETRLLALGINPEPYPAEEDEEDQDDDEDGSEEIIETRHFLIGGILLEHADNTSDIRVRGTTATEALIAAFLAFRIWAKNYEGI